LITARNLTLVCAAWSVLAAQAVAASTTPTLSSAIAPQPLAQALSEFASQTGLQIIYVSDIAAAERSRGASSGLAVREALELLLEGTGLRFEFLNERTVRIYAGESAVLARPESPRSAATRPPVPDPRRLAPLEEVVVTSSRREEPMSMVPISSAVWTEEAMEASRVKGINEIGALTPGVQFGFNSRLGDYFTNIVIRGVADRHGQTTTLFLDDTPLPSGRGDTFLREFPVTFDVDRVDVLRGPQGGRLGHDTLAGALRFITNEPSLATRSGVARAEVASTDRGEPSFEAGSAVGGPLVPDVLGFRVSAWYRSDGGYVDRVDRFTGVTVDDDSNQTSSSNFRAALTWAPTQSVRITPAATYQSIDGRDVAAFYTDLSNPAAGELRNGSQIRQPWFDRFYLASLKIEKTFESVDLRSVTSYQNRTVNVEVDGSPIDSFEPVTQHSFLKQNFLFHETRVISEDPARALNWTAGVAFTDSGIRESSGPEEIVSATLTEQTTFTGFGEVSLRVTDHLTANTGLRLGQGRYDSVTRVPPTARAQDTESWATPNFGLSYQAGSGTRLYLMAAEGYRIGGVYPPVFGCGDAPVPYASDTLWSYEFGAKQSGLLDHRLDLDANIFHIRWTNPQTSPMEGCIAYSYRSASAAVSNGFNLSARLFLSDKSRIGLAIGYTDAHYTKTVLVDDVVIIQDGDSVGADAVGSQPPWSATASIEKDFTVSSGIEASVRAEYVYHSQNPGPFLTEHEGSPDYRPEASADPATRLLNLRAVLSWARFETALFVDNALDAQPTFGRTNVCCDDPQFTATTYRPRTVGISATWRL
jgi:outer membrane receptor protein involved in Fe transport